MNKYRIVKKTTFFGDGYTKNEYIIEKKNPWWWFWKKWSMIILKRYYCYSFYNNILKEKAIFEDFYINPDYSVLNLKDDLDRLNLYPEIEIIFVSNNQPKWMINKTMYDSLNDAIESIKSKKIICVEKTIL